MQHVEIVVVGAGAAGLSTAGALKRRGIDAVVLERDDALGGSWSRRYERLHLHTIRRFSGLAHHPIPRSYPRYLSKDEYARYLREYADVLGIEVSLGEPATTVRREERWVVGTPARSLAARIVVIATGHYAVARLPAWPGIDVYGGRLLHSAGYRHGGEFTGRAVLVVGIGNSGAEIAADLVERGAASVDVAVRTPPPIVTRELFGVVPVQLLGIALMPLGIPRAVDRVGAALRRLSIGDLGAYGLGPAGWGPFTARRPAVIDAGFLPLLKAGRIRIAPAVERLTPTGAGFADGSWEDYDVIVAATGYDTGLESLLRVDGVVGTDSQPLAAADGSTAREGLFVIGFDETIRGHLFEARRASVRLARTVERLLRA